MMLGIDSFGAVITVVARNNEGIVLAATISRTNSSIPASVAEVHAFKWA